MTERFTPPIFHFSDDVTSFASIEALCRYVEPWDVGERDRAFDSHGRRIVLRGVGVRRARRSVGGGETVLDPDASGDLASEEFSTLLRQHVRQAGADEFALAGVDVASVALDALVAAVDARTRTT